MKLLIATDHAGIDLKNTILEHLRKSRHEVIDMTPIEKNPQDDYPIIMHPVAVEVSRDPNNTRAIILGGSGMGEAIEANRHKGVRAAVYYGGNVDVIKASREHNNSNVLSLGARFVSIEDALNAVDLWLTTPFSGNPRHIRRIQELDSI